MSKQNLLDQYFLKRKEIDDTCPSVIEKVPRLNSPDARIHQATTYHADDYNVSSRYLSVSADGHEVVNQLTEKTSEPRMESVTTTDTSEKGSYRPWYSERYDWLEYEPNVGGFCRVCRAYWTKSTPSYREMERKSMGVFISVPFTNWRKAPGETGRLMKHARSEHHGIAVENQIFRRKEGSVFDQLSTVSEVQKRENRERVNDLIKCSYFLFKNELPHTLLYNRLLQLATDMDHSGKISEFFGNCKRNATYDSATSVTEFLESTSEIIERDLLIKVRNARVITIMSDEGTDINRHGNLCICLRFCEAVSGEPNEMYISLLQLKEKDAESIFNTLVKELQRRQIDMSKTRFVGFDGAAVFSGIHTGVAARLRGTFNRAILFIHCRAHALQLAVISASHSFPDIARCLSSLKSLVNFINRSSLRLSAFEDMQEILGNQHIKLILPGDTRWLSNAMAVRALLRSYRSALSTLEHIYNEGYEDCAEALGLHDILSTQSTAFILHAMDPILDTLSILSKTIQSKTIDFQQLQNFTSSTLLRLEELKDYTSSDYINILERIRQLQLKPSMLRISRSSRSEELTDLRGIFDDKVVPFIDAVIGNIKSRFDQNTFTLLQCFSILDMENVTEENDYGEKEIAALQQHYPEDFDSALLFEWKTFRKYLLTQKSTGKEISQREICIKLVQNGVLKDVYPQLSLAAEIFLIALVSTATVERDFSAMNRILNKLRNRLTTVHLDELMRISVEGPETLSEQMIEEIINLWKSKKQRRLQV